MRERQLMVWGGVLIAVAALLYLPGILSAPLVTPLGTNEPAPGSLATSAPTTFTAVVPTDAVLTDAVNEAPAAPGASERFKIFDLAADVRGYHPQTLTVQWGDITQIRFSATDGEYDLFVPYAGLYQSVPRGETKQITFQATTAGTFQFFCRDHCPSDGRIEGEIVVMPK